MSFFNPETQRYRLVFNMEEELVNHVVGLYNEADINFHQHCPYATLIIAQLMGEDLSRYSYAENVTEKMQDMFNRAIIEINKEIVEKMFIGHLKDWYCEIYIALTCLAYSLSYPRSTGFSPKLRLRATLKWV